MKNNFIVILSAVILFMGWVQSDAAENNFKTLELEMNPKDAEVLFRKEPYDTSTFPVAVLENGTRIPGRVEVSGQFTRTFLKKSLLIRLNEGQTWQGNKKISLHSMSTDPSYMRDWLAWNLSSSLGMVTPKVEYYRLNINGQFIGLYLFIEWIDTSMFNRIGLGKDGEFYHPDDTVYCGDMTPANQYRLEECWFKLSPKDRDYTSLRKLIEEINSTPVEQFHNFLNEHFDVDSVINYLVVNTITGNGDTYNKNYFLYHSTKTGKWIIIPWDFDLTFGRNADPVLPFPRNILNDNYQYFYTPELGSPNPLKEKTLKNDRLYKLFKNRISHVLGGTMKKEPQGFLEKLHKESTPVGGFAWFRPREDEFAGLVNKLEHNIGQDLRHEKYPGAKGEPFIEQVEALRLYNQWRYPLLQKMILEPTPFNTAHWLPYFTFPPFTPSGEEDKNRRQTVQLNMTASVDIKEGDKSVVLMEELLARPVGILDVQEINRPARVRLEVETERVPESLPPGLNPSRCIQRIWYLDLKTPDTILKVNLQFDYLQESSLRHELGDSIADEHNLSLWVQKDNRWQKLPTEVNVIANILQARGIELVSGNVLRFVACEE